MPLIEIRKGVERARILDLEAKAFNARVGNYMVSSTQRKIRDGAFEPNAPLTVAVKQNSRPLRDTGLLMASITYRPGADCAKVGTNRAGAAINHFGGEQRPRHGSWLWIPAGRETRKLLGSYGTVSGIIAGLKREGCNTWFKKGKGGCLCFFAKKGKNGKTRLLFILKKSVKIPARPFLKYDQTDIKVINAMADRMLGKGGSGNDQKSS